MEGNKQTHTHTNTHTHVHTYTHTHKHTQRRAADAVENNANEKVTFKNYDSFINCISEINNAQVDNAKDIDIVMLMYNLM